jgi:hypothetical protein
MSRSITPGWRHHLLLGLVLALLAPLTVLASGAAAEVGPEDTPPIINSASVSPNSMPYTGGTATLTVNASDDFAIYQADVSVQNPDGSGLNVPLYPSAIEATSVTYSGSFEVPPNYSDQQLTYYVNVMVYDTNGGFDLAELGEVTVDAQPQFDEPPTVSDPFVSPRDLPASGGPVTLRVSAYDLRGISYAYARVTAPDGGLTDVELIPISSSEFEGVFEAPANTTGDPLTYGVKMTALDDIGQETWIDGGQLTVAGRAAARHGKACSARHSGGRSPCAKGK